MTVVTAEKYHGTENDFLVLPADAPVPDRAAFAKTHCDRETGVGGERTGADGVLFLDLDPTASPVRVTMTLVQPDGSTAAMCGNGARVTAVWAARETGAREVLIETPAGDRHAVVQSDGVTVEMGRPSFEPADVPLAPDHDGPLIDEEVEGLTVTAVNTGVPHAVAFVDDVDAVDLETVAPPVRHAAVFPEGANVTLAARAEVGDEAEIREGAPGEPAAFRQRTFERGVEGETLACGTGAVAVVAAAKRTGRLDTEGPVRVSPPGGDLVIVVPDDGPATLTGPVERPVDFLDAAVRIDSHEDVTEMRDFLVETLRNHGADPVVDDAGNTLATTGSGSPHVLLNTHIDTVSPHVPYEREGGVIHGRGSCDAKGPLAVILSAFFAFDADDADGRLTLAITPDEEVYSTGAAALDLSILPGIDSPIADFYIVGEPTGLDICTAAKGRFEGTLHLSGRNAHAAEPETGVNAVAAAEGALAAIRAFDADRDPHPDLGPATLTPTVIDGGEATNQVPADCAITVDRRSVPPETAEEFAAELERAVDDATPGPVGVDFAPTERPTPFLEAFATDPDSPVVRHLASAADRVTDGAAGTVRPFTAATEASYFAPAPTVVFGPGVLADDEGPVAHADREYVRTAEVERAATALTEALSELLG